MELHRELGYEQPNGSSRRAILALSFFSVWGLDKKAWEFDSDFEFDPVCYESI